MLINTSSHAESLYDVEPNINDLNTPMGTNTASYYEEMGRIFALLEPSTPFDALAFAENPLPELTFDDILDCVYEDIQHPGGLGGTDWLLPSKEASTITRYLNPQEWLNLEDGMYTIHEIAQYGGGGFSRTRSDLEPAASSSTGNIIPYQYNSGARENIHFGCGL